MRLALVAVVGLWFVLGQVDSVLLAMQAPDQQAYGMNDLSGLTPSGLPERVEEVRLVWKKAGHLATAAVWAYFALDVAFIVGLIFLLVLVFRRLATELAETELQTGARRAAQRPNGPIVAFAVADLTEDTLRLLLIQGGPPPDWLVYAAWACTSLKWLALAILAVLLLVLARARLAGSTVGTDGAWAAGQLRVPLVLVGVWSALVLIDPTGQSPDLLRPEPVKPNETG